MVYPYVSYFLWILSFKTLVFILFDCDNYLQNYKKKLHENDWI